MPFIPVPNTAELVLEQAMLGQLVNNVLNFEFPDVPDTVDLTDLASAALTAWIADMAPLLTDRLDLNAMTATSLETVSSPSITVFAPSGTDGAISSVANPLNVAVVISSRTDSRGRSFRGRYYQAGTSQAGNENEGSISATYLADLLAGFADFIDAIETAKVVPALAAQSTPQEPSGFRIEGATQSGRVQLEPESVHPAPAGHV